MLSFSLIFLPEKKPVDDTHRMKKSVYLKETGIILSIVPYGETDAIANTFTQDSGLLSFFFRNALGKNRFHMFEPFTLGEFSYEETASLFKLKEFSCLDAHISLRDNLERIESASLIIKALEKTQGPGLCAPSLFTLLTLYLRWISKVKDPKAIAASFLLKTLKHEGLFYYSNECYECGQQLTETVASEGILCCSRCKQDSFCTLNREETSLFGILSEAREFKEIASLQLSESFLGKIKHFFEASLQE